MCKITHFKVPKTGICQKFVKISFRNDIRITFLPKVSANGLRYKLQFNKMGSFQVVLTRVRKIFAIHFKIFLKYARNVLFLIKGNTKTLIEK